MQTPTKMFQLNVFVNNPSVTPALLRKLDAGSGKLSKLLAAGAVPPGLGEHDLVQLGASSWHRDMDGQPRGSRRKLAQFLIKNPSGSGGSGDGSGSSSSSSSSSGGSAGSSGGSAGRFTTGTWLRTASGDVLLPTGPGWGLSFNAKLLTVMMHKPHAPPGSMTATLVANSSPPGTKQFVAEAPPRVPLPALPADVNGVPLRIFQQSYVPTPCEWVDNLHDKDISGGRWRGPVRNRGGAAAAASGVAAGV